MKQSPGPTAGDTHTAPREQRNVWVGASQRKWGYPVLPQASSRKHAKSKQTVKKKKKGNLDV